MANKNHTHNDLNSVNTEASNTTQFENSDVHFKDCQVLTNGDHADCNGYNRSDIDDVISRAMSACCNASSKYKMSTLGEAEDLVYHLDAESDISDDDEGDDDGLPHINSSSSEQSLISEEYLASLDYIDITMKNDCGVMKHILIAGSGQLKPVHGDTVYVHYLGYLQSGVRFCSSQGYQECYTYKIGSYMDGPGQAWDIALCSMVEGERSLFLCKPSYAYGDNGLEPLIPGGATVVYILQVSQIEGTDISPKDDGSIRKSVLHVGLVNTKPYDRALIRVHVNGFLDNSQFDNREVDFTLCEGALHGLCEGIEISIMTMRVGEKSRFVIKENYAFGNDGNAQYGIPPRATIVYNIKLLDVQNVKQHWEMNAPQKLAAASQIKDKGTEHYKNGDISMARKYYDVVVNMLQLHDQFLSDEVAQRKELLLAAYLNLALCGLKTNDNLEVLFNCEKALALEPLSEKAYYRQGCANYNIKNLEQALSDFEHVTQINPSNGSAAQRVTQLKGLLAGAKTQERQMFQGMFDKFAAADAKKDVQYGDVFENLNNWDNRMADDFLPLDKEMEAFGEIMPKARYEEYQEQEGEVDSEEDVG